MTKFRMLFSLLLFFAMVMPATAAEWLKNYPEALELSARSHKPLLLFFNGSDWSVTGMKMKHEILDTPAFHEGVGNRFICVEIDFPEHSSLSDPLAAQNRELKTYFKIDDVPTLLVLDSSERVISQICYLPESGARLAHDLLQLLALDAKLFEAMQHLSGTAEELKELYILAQDLGQQPNVEKILAEGVKTGDSFFLLEKYRLICEEGQMKNQAGISLRQKLLEADPENKQGLQLSLAMIDFQALAQEKSGSAHDIVHPLVNYLERFGASDSNNVWRIEMMIAQIFMEADLKEEALSHAEKALNAAPQAMHEEIAHSLEYIRTSKVSS